MAAALRSFGLMEIMAYVGGKMIARCLGAEIGGNFGKPIRFHTGSGGAEHPPIVSNGCDETLMISLCKEITRAEADGTLLDRQFPMGKQAHVILNASANAGIKGLAYALTGYDQTRKEVIGAMCTTMLVSTRESSRTSFTTCGFRMNTQEVNRE